MSDVVGGVLVDTAGEVVMQVPAAGFTAALPWTDVVWRGRVFRFTGRVPGADGAMVMRFSEQHAMVLETPFVCPGCGVERTDVEGMPDAWLPQCPDCGDEGMPVPCGLAVERPRTVTVPRELMATVRGALRAATGHWAAGFDGLGRQITQHDRLMDDGSCVTCALLALLDEQLYGVARPAGASDGS